MRRRRSARIGVAAVGVLALLAAGSLRSVPTEAAWSDAEYARSNAITSASLTAPTAVTCVPRSVVLIGLQSFTLTWSSPQQGAQQVQITKNSNSGSDVQGTAGSAITQVGNANGTYQYAATYTTAKLLSLVNLGDLLGGTYTIRVYNGYAGSSWLSPPKTFQLNVALLGLGSSCTAA